MLSPPTTDKEAVPTALTVSAIHALFDDSPSSPEIQAWLNTLQPISPDPGPPPKPVIKSYPDASYHAYHSLGLDLVYASAGTLTGSSGQSWRLERIDLYNPFPASSAPTASASSSRRKQAVPYQPPALPLVLYLPLLLSDESSASSPTSPSISISGSSRTFSIDARTTGREFVSALGEPARKGGGTGWVGPWLEWSDLRVLLPADRTIGAADTSAAGASAAEGFEADAVGKRAGGAEWEEARVGLMVELRESGLAKVSEEEMKKGLGGLWDRAGAWEWGCVKVFKVGSSL